MEARKPAGSYHGLEGINQFCTDKDEQIYDTAAREAEKKKITNLLNKINVFALLSRAASVSL